MLVLGDHSRAPPRRVLPGEVRERFQLRTGSTSALSVSRSVWSNKLRCMLIYNLFERPRPCWCVGLRSSSTSTPCRRPAGRRRSPGSAAPTCTCRAAQVQHPHITSVHPCFLSSIAGQPRRRNTSLLHGSYFDVFGDSDVPQDIGVAREESRKYYSTLKFILEIIQSTILPLNLF